MRSRGAWIIVAGLVVVGCSRTPTTPTISARPTPSPTPAATVAPTPIPTPMPTPRATPTPVFPPADPRFDLRFYRQFAHGGVDQAGLWPLLRQTEAPHIYLRTIDDRGIAIEAATLDRTAAALVNTTGSLTGVFGLAGLERGTGSAEGRRDWITVRWSADERANWCGTAVIGGSLITLYPRVAGCRCPGGPAVALAVVKHELGHALGFWHTDGRDDLMYVENLGACDWQPSAREVYHAAVAYTRPIGSASP